MLDILVIVVLIAASVWLGTRLFLRAPDHSQFDTPIGVLACGRTAASPQIAELHRLVDDMAAEVQGVPRREQLAVLRQLMGRGLLGAPVSAEALGVTVIEADANGVPAEWVLSAGADDDRRLLYIHGGGFYAGSPTSARMLTAALSEACGVAVLSIDYRLMPENYRLDSVADCQNAYRYMLSHGPNGVSEARQAFVAGDSAGGNLTLMLSAWARDADVRLMDGVIAFSPSTDSTLEGKSFKSNIGTDPMLGPSLGVFAKLPATIKALIGLLMSRVNPRNPSVSPLFGGLAGLPPTLVQVSDCEMLVDDGRRYVNKARSEGSPAELQTWPGMVHVFQMFGHVLPEAGEAIGQVAEFVANPAAIRQPEQETSVVSAQPI